MDHLHSQVLGGVSNPIAICQRLVPTSLDVSTDDGSDMGAERQLVDYESKSYEESDEEIPLTGIIEGWWIYTKFNSHISSTIPEILTLERSSSCDRQLVFYEDGNSRNPIAPPVTSQEGAKIVSLESTPEVGSYERSEIHTMRLSDTLTHKPSDRVMSETSINSVRDTYSDHTYTYNYHTSRI